MYNSYIQQYCTQAFYVSADVKIHSLGVVRDEGEYGRAVGDFVFTKDSEPHTDSCVELGRPCICLPRFP